jgi:NADH:ubiquinone oxidoreductase subunit E
VAETLTNVSKTLGNIYHSDKIFCCYNTKSPTQAVCCVCAAVACHLYGTAATMGIVATLLSVIFGG